MSITEHRSNAAHVVLSGMHARIRSEQSPAQVRLSPQSTGGCRGGWWGSGYTCGESGSIATGLSHI